MRTSALAQVLQAFEAALGNPSNLNSVHDHLERAGGHIISNEITLSANAGAGTNNIFQVTKTVKVFRLFAFITDATVLANLTAGQFTLWDGAADDAITKNDGVLSGMAVDTFMAKNALKTVTMAIANNVNGAVTEQAADKKAFQSFFATQKTGQNTYIRWKYTTTDAPINAKLLVLAEYKGLNGGTLVAV